MFEKYNFAEHLAINSFVIGQATLVGLVAFALSKITIFFNPLVYLAIIWMTYKIFKTNNDRSNIFIHSIVTTFCFLFNGLELG